MNEETLTSPSHPAENAAPLESESTKAASTKALLKIRPTFVHKIAMVEALLVGILGAVFGTVLLGVILTILFMLLGLGSFMPGWLGFALGFLISITILPAGYFELKKRAYQKSAFLFFADHLEFRDFNIFMNRNTGRIRYAEISDVFEKSNLLQQMEDIKTIYLQAPRFGLRDRTGFAGIKIKDVPIGQGMGRQIVDLIEAHNKNLS
jgi:hypothetical protein